MIRPGLDVLVPVPATVAVEACRQAAALVDRHAFRMEVEEVDACRWVRVCGPSRVRWADAKRMAGIHRAYCLARG
jgi:hypothetical protein